MLPLAETDPRYLDRLDPDAVMESLHDASPALPASILRPREVADKIAAQRAEQQEQAQQMEMAQAMGGVAKDAAGAAAMVMPQGGGHGA